MGANSDLPLAIRVIVTTTRAGVRSHETTGRHELIEPTVDRGMELLDALGRDAVGGADEEHIADARRELSELRSGVGVARPDQS